MKRKKLNVFSLSFLDIITCGLGAIILLFVLINAKSAAHQDTVTSDFRAEASRRLAIPMAPGTESLNVAMAGAILLFALDPCKRGVGRLHTDPGTGS